MSEEEQKAIEKFKRKIERADKDILNFSDVYTTLDIHNLRLLLKLVEKQQKEIEELKENSISKEVIKKEIKKLNEKNGISFDMYTGQILKTKEDYQIAILKKLLRRKL